MVSIKRVYESASKEDGYRILVDRLWPRGVSKAEAKVDYWLKEVAPSEELRKWFNHEPDKWKEFISRYLSELETNPALDELKDILKQHQASTLVFAAKDEAHNNAVALQQCLQQ